MILHAPRIVPRPAAGRRCAPVAPIETVLLVALAALGLAACGGGGSAPEPAQTADTPPANSAPPPAPDDTPPETPPPDAGDAGGGSGELPPPPLAADAGPDQSVLEGTPVVLAGMSGDPEASGLLFLWTQIGGTAVTLIDADTPTATFTYTGASGDETLSFRLTVANVAGESASDDVDVTVLDSAPTADAGIDQAVSAATETVLDGLGSAAWDVIASYRWQQIAGRAVTLETPVAARARFLAPDTSAPLVLEFRLTVTEADGDIDTDTVSVTVFPPLAVPADADRFLEFLNPTRPIFAGSEASAQAYYAAVDPTGEKATLAGFLAANGFGQAGDARAVYRNAADLGFGRIMTLRRNADGSVAAYVENYPTLESAIGAEVTGTRTELLATVAMEYSAGASGGEYFTKFFTYGPDDQRITSIDLDGRGAKFVPGLCNVCHGGEPQALANGAYPQEGHTNAQFLPWDLDTYEFSTDPAFTRDAQQAQFKALNQGALATYPATAANGTWSGRAARELIEGWYGGPGMPSPTFDGRFVPPGWRTAANGGSASNPSDAEELYLDVIGPNCRACHIMRGRHFDDYAQGDYIDFASYDAFIAYEDRTAELVLDEGKMPDARVTYANFWSNRDGIIAAEQLARHLGANPIERRPGRPLANAGPSRSAPLGVVALNGTASDFAETFAWSFAPGGRPAASTAAFSSTTSATPTIVTDSPGAYRLRLVVGNADGTSAAEEVAILSTFGVAPLRFASDIVPRLMGTCGACHSAGGAQSVAGIPVHFDNPATIYEAVLAYVDFEDVARSPIVMKPSGQRHGGGIVQGFNLSTNAAADNSLYDELIRWISEGAPNN